MNSMITSVLDKIESAWIRLDWREYVDRLKLTPEQIESVIETIDTFKRNRKAKDLIIFKYRQMPAYVCVVREEFGELLDWFYAECIKRESYEICQKIVDIKKVI